MENRIIGIGGMTCAACSRRVEKVIGRLDGVESVTVNLVTEKASVTYDPVRVRASAIRESIEKAGFKALEIHADASLDKAREKRQREIRTLRIKLAVAASFGLPLFYVAMAPMASWIRLPLPEMIHPDANPLLYALVQLVLLIPIVCAGYRFYTVGFRALAGLSPNMDSLIAVGTTAAAVYSVYNTIRIAGGDIHAAHSLYYESAGVIIALILLGKTLEAASKRKTGEAVRKLAGLSPRTAIIMQDGEEKEVPADEVETGDIVVVKPGARIPADGTVLEGSTAVDESMLTGESMPVDKKTGDAVYAATVNTNGMIRFQAEKTGSETALAGIIRLVEEAQGSKAPIARTADIVSGYFVPAVCAVAFTAGIAWYIGTRDLGFALRIFISVLIIACPCALGLATPTAIMAGTGRGAVNGMLIKGGEALEAAHKINAVVFDKTGTLTEGKPSVTDILPVEGISEEELLWLAASVEKPSEHPVGKAIVQSAAEKGLEVLAANAFTAQPGLGVEASAEGHRIAAGNQRMMKEHGIILPEHARETVLKLAELGKTPVYVAADGKLAGLIAVADTIRQSSREAVENLKKMHIEVVMLTGDSHRTALAVAKQIGVENVLSEVLPQHKSEAVKKLQSEGKTVAMVGDGINDAPALAQADVGIAIGSGTDVAMESAAVVLMRSDPSDVPAAIDLSKKTMRNIRQNLFWAFGYNTLSIPVAAGVLYLFGGPLLNPMVAAAAMSLSSISVLVNALRLNAWSRKKAFR